MVLPHHVFKGEFEVNGQKINVQPSIATRGVKSNAFEYHAIKTTPLTTTISHKILETSTAPSNAFVSLTTPTVGVEVDNSQSGIVGISVVSQATLSSAQQEIQIPASVGTTNQLADMIPPVVVAEVPVNQVHNTPTHLSEGGSQNILPTASTDQISSNFSIEVSQNTVQIDEVPVATSEATIFTNQVIENQHSLSENPGTVSEYPISSPQIEQPFTTPPLADTSVDQNLQLSSEPNSLNPSQDEKPLEVPVEAPEEEISPDQFAEYEQSFSENGEDFPENENPFQTEQSFATQPPEILTPPPKIYQSGFTTDSKFFHYENAKKMLAVSPLPQVQQDTVNLINLNKREVDPRTFPQLVTCVGIASKLDILHDTLINMKNFALSEEFAKYFDNVGPIIVYTPKGIAQQVQDKLWNRGIPFVIKTITFNNYPSHVRNIRNHAWKAVLQANTLIEFGNIFYFDFYSRVLPDRFDALAQSVSDFLNRKECVLFPAPAFKHSVSAMTCDLLLEYFQVNHENLHWGKTPMAPMYRTQSKKIQYLNSNHMESGQAIVIVVSKKIELFFSYF